MWVGALCGFGISSFNDEQFYCIYVFLGISYLCRVAVCGIVLLFHQKSLEISKMINVKLRTCRKSRNWPKRGKTREFRYSFVTTCFIFRSFLRSVSRAPIHQTGNCRSTAVQIAVQSGVRSHPSYRVARQRASSVPARATVCCTRRVFTSYLYESYLVRQ